MLRLPASLRLLPLSLAISLLVRPVAAQNPPLGRELPRVCASGNCTGGVSSWAAPGPGAPARAVNGRTMTIRQPRQRELYNWESFDVGAGYKVEFEQKFGSAAVALNRVLGKTNPQSFINGQVKAPGEVYVINQNGIVFGPQAKVDTHSLTASTLKLWDDQEFLAGGLTAAIRKTDAAGNPTPEPAFDHSGAAGDIEVRKGARITSAKGGRVLLVAPKVENAGRIETPDGQTVLAGSHDRVYIAAADDPNLRGLVVEVDTGGRVDNLGEIIAERGNVSMVGLAVNQDGVARATTAVNFNGSVRLSARHKANPGAIVNNGGNVSINTAVLQTTPDADDPEQTFGVRLGRDSVTEVLPDQDTTTRAIDAAPQRPSIVEAVGKTVALERDARITAPGGQVSLRGVSGDVPGEVKLARGARIDVAGTTDSVLPMSANIGELELRGNELADFPLQRDGVLRGRKVFFDLRELRFVDNDAADADDDQYFLPVGNVTAAVTGVRRGVSERLARGGSITIDADRADLASGSLVDFSGGRVTVEPGFVQTSLLISQGRVFDIHEAPPNLVYDAVLPFLDVDYNRWGVSERYNVFGRALGLGRFEAGYTVGYDAGSLSIRALDVTLDGRLRGEATPGRLQRELPGAVIGGRQRFSTERPLAGLFELGSIALGTGLPVGPAGIRLGTRQADDDDLALALPAQLFNDGGINRVHVISGGAVRLGDFTLDAGGELALTGSGDSRIDGQVSIAGGTVAVDLLQPPALRPSLTVTEEARIDVAGRWVNDTPLLNPAGPTAPLFIHGGEVRLGAAGDLTLEAGSLIDVSGAARLTAAGALEAGHAGSIRLTSLPANAETLGTQMTLDGELRGHGLENGGGLELRASAFDIASIAHPERAGRVQLTPAFFTNGGFTHYTLHAESAQDAAGDVLIDVAPGTRVAARAESLVLGGDFNTAPTGTDFATLTELALLPVETRPATHIAFDTQRRLYEQADARPSIVIGRGARLGTEIGGAIQLVARDRIVVDGELDAPAGSIKLELRDAGDQVGFRNEGLWLLDGAALTARGADRSFIDSDGLRTGEILAGGSITLAATRGAVVIAPEALLDVSGTVGTLERLDNSGARPEVRAERVATAAGSIVLRASETLLPYGELRGQAGGAGAAGGSLRVTLDLTGRLGNAAFTGSLPDLFPEDARVLTLGERADWQDTWVNFGDAGFEAALRTSGIDAAGRVDTTLGVHGTAAVDAAAVMAGGFDALELGARQSIAQRADGVSQFLGLPAEVRMAGTVSLSLQRELRIDAPILSSDGGSARLAAPYVQLGSTNRAFRVGAVETRNLFEPFGGAGRLDVRADALDLVGFSSLQGFGHGTRPITATSPVRLAARGDLRLHGLPVPPLNSNTLSALSDVQGAFETATSLTLEAAQIYPTTLSEFTVAVRGETGTLTVRGNGRTSETPLSAGGVLTLAAPNIVQGGVLRAPLGRIELSAGASDATAIARARAAATSASPYDGARVVQALAAAGNQGRGDVRGAVATLAALDPSDYRLTYQGDGRYSLLRLRDGLERSIDTGGASLFTTATIDGFRLTLRNTAQVQPGDSYLIRHGDEAVLGSNRLLAGSLTSVSGADLPVPFGQLLLENNWVLPINGVARTLDEPRIFESNPSAAALEQRPFNAPDRPWTKRIAVTGADIELADGARLDLSGGGDLIAAEFRPGPGGSRDLLGSAADGLAFALVPSLSLGPRPRDPFYAMDDALASSFAPELPAVSVADLDLTVEIGPGSALAPGRYQVLPRAYALLPGAFLVSPETSLRDLPSDGGGLGLDGVPVVAARFAVGTGQTAQQRPIGLRVESRAQVFERAEYAVATANQFFAARAEKREQLAPQLPGDGGRLVLSATDSLRLAGQLAPNTGSGRSAQVDVVADSLAVVGQLSGASDRVELLADDLNGLGAESLLLGGTRSFAESSFELDLTAREVSVASDVRLRLPELLLGARESVDIAGRIDAVGTVKGAPSLSFGTNGDGTPRSRALVRVSADGQVDLTGESAAGGIVRVRDGASLRAPGSITIDGSSDVFIDGRLASAGGSVSLNTSRISIGQVPAGTGGLVMPALDAFAARDLRLVSATSIDFYGELPEHRRFDSLVLDAEALRGFDAGGAIGAGSLVLRNSGTAGAPAAGSGGGVLRFDADTLEFAGGDMAWSGFARVALNAPTVVASGDTVLTSAADVDLTSATLSSREGGRLALDVDGDLRVLARGAASDLYDFAGAAPSKRVGERVGLGGRLRFAADDIELASVVRLPSGSIELEARDGDVRLGAGAVLDVAGQLRRFDTRLTGTEGGSVSLHAATGDVVLAAGSVIDVAGTAVDARNVAAAGEVVLRAPRGEVALAAGSLLGGFWTMQGDDAYTLLATNDTTVARAGRLSLDVGRLGTDGIAWRELAANGFVGALGLRVRDGDLTIAADQLLRAADIRLAADRGRLDVVGTLDASAPAGGRIALAAGGDLVVDGSLHAAATARDEDGGSVELASREGRITFGADGDIDVRGRRADGTASVDGLVRIIAPRGADNASVAVDPLAGGVLGAGSIEVIANRVYAGIERIDALETAVATQVGLDTLRADNDAFAPATPGLVTALDPDGALGARLVVMPGIEIRSDAGRALELATDWALTDWRAGTAPGLLTLRAGGNLLLNGGLSDGLTQRDNLQALTNFSLDPADFGKVDMLLDGASWSYRLVAGADLDSATGGGAPAVAAADALAVRDDGEGDLRLANNRRVRTGTGSIEIAAAGDVRYLGNGAAIYTMGRSAGYGNIAFDPLELDALGAFIGDFLDLQLAFGFDYGSVLDGREDIAFAPYFFDRYLPGAVFGEQGGDIRIEAGGDIVGPGSTQLMTQWLVVMGGESGDVRLTLGGLELPTMWAIRPELFRQNLGTLGGGDIAIAAGGEVSNLSVVLPTSGRPDGEGFTYLPFTGAFGNAGVNAVTELGGGDLTLRAGGDLLAPRVLVGRGSAEIRSGGRIGATVGASVDALFALGHGNFDVVAAEGVTLEAMFNFSMMRRPLIAAPGGGTLDADTRSYFFTYGEGSALAVDSLAGDVLLENRTRSTDPIFASILGNAGVTSADESALRIYPGSVRVRAFGGDVQLARGFQLFPDADGTLEMLSAGSITDLGFEVGRQRVTVVQSDADVRRLPSVGNPAAGSPGIGSTFLPAKQRPVSDDQRAWHATVPVHLEDDEPSLLIALGGTIGQARPEARGFRLFLAEPGRIIAGRDILNLDFEIQHVAAGQASVVRAGRDFIYTPNRDLAGNLAQSQQERFQGALFSGPGRGLVLAGRNIDLGTSDGIVSVGNLRNFALPDSGASLHVFAGAGEGPDLARFYARYLRDLPATSAEAVPYLQALVGKELSAEEAASMFKDLEAARRALAEAGVAPGARDVDLDLGSAPSERLLALFFGEIERAGVGATTTGSDDYSRGFAAIETLFPGKGREGALSLLLSRIHTEDGGDINLYVPGGSANTGAAATASVTKSENELGVVVQSEGDVRGFVRDDFLVNASRVFALQGGDILLWASEGDIDAGRGAKSALAAPPPQVVFDPASGQFVTVFPPEVAGSGIRNFAPPGTVPGNVFLFAPQGVISAGDAGIASAGNITIGAREVIGADNIDVGGTAVGVPQADIGVAAGLSSVSNVANAAARGAQDSAAENAKEAAAMAANTLEQPSVSIISVEVLGFGG